MAQAGLLGKSFSRFFPNADDRASFGVRRADTGYRSRALGRSQRDGRRRVIRIPIAERLAHQGELRSAGQARPKAELAMRQIGAAIATENCDLRPAAPVPNRVRPPPVVNGRAHVHSRPALAALECVERREPAFRTELALSFRESTPRAAIPPPQS